MARAVQEKSIENATASTAGSVMQTGGRVSVSLWVLADNLDDANDTLDVQIEVSMNDGTDWALLRDETGTQVGNVTLSEFDDPDGNGNFTAFVTVHGVAADQVRARITTLTDSAGGDLSVDAVVAASSNPNSAKRYRSA